MEPTPPIFGGAARFIRYLGVGIITFSVDLGLLFFFTNTLGIYYLYSTAMAFAVAATLNYALSRLHVFRGTTRPVRTGYVISILIAGVGLLAITGLMYVFVGVFSINYLISRVVVAVMVGMWGYLMNLYVNFRVG